VCDGERASLNRCAYEVGSGVLLRSPIKCIIGGARVTPTTMRDRFRHQPIGAKWQCSGGAEEFSAALRHRRWIADEKSCNDPLQEPTRAGKCPAQDHPVTERSGGWARPEAAWKCGPDALGLRRRRGNRHAASGATNIDTEARIGEARANDGGEPVVYSCGNRHTSREAKIFSWTREQCAYPSTREHLRRECALIKACS
jgi:hypothetical protein